VNDDSGCAAVQKADDTSHRSVVERLFQALQDVDVTVIDELVSLDVVDHSPMLGRRSFEPAVLKAVARDFKTAFPDVCIRLDALLVEEDLVSVTEYVTGTNTGPFQGRPPTGGPLTVRATHLMRIAGGRIVEHWAVRDMSSLEAIARS
jgi:predicted ester cyclase